MPHHKSAEKRLKTNERDRTRNMTVKSSLRKDIKKVSGAAPASPEAVSDIYSSLDRAARKGVIPKSRANRLKSRLARANRSS